MYNNEERKYSKAKAPAPEFQSRRPRRKTPSNIETSKNKPSIDLAPFLELGLIKGTIVNKLPDSVVKLIKATGKRYTDTISLVFWACLYTQLSDVIFEYLLELDKKQFARFADRWYYNGGQSKNNTPGRWMLRSGTTFFKYIGNATWIHASVVQPKNSEDSSDALRIYIIGKDMYRVQKMIQDRVQSKSERPSIPMHNLSYNAISGSVIDEVDYYGCRTRPLESVFMDPSVKSGLIEYINKWMEKRELFEKTGAIYKLGILLYGKPGTGKTSLVKAIATEFDCHLFTIDTKDMASMNMGELAKTITNAPGSDVSRPKIILFEDIDVSTKVDRSADATMDERKTMNSLMQMLDGTYSVNNAIYIATTNYIDRIDPAVLREGRFDKKIELTDIDRSCAEDMCKWFGVNPNKFLGNKYTYPINSSKLQADILNHLLRDIKTDDTKE